MPLPITIPPNIKSAAIRSQPWLILGLLLTSIATLLLSVVPNNVLRRGLAVVTVGIGQKELSILTNGGTSAGPTAEDGGKEDIFYINMWGWCIEDTCSGAKLPPSFKLLGEMSDESPLKADNFPPALTGMLLAHGLGCLLAIGSAVSLGLELWEWWQEQSEPSTAHPFHEIIADFALLSRIRSGAPSTAISPGGGLYLAIVAYLLLLLHVLAWVGPNAYQSTIEYWTGRREWYHAWKEGVLDSQAHWDTQGDVEKGSSGKGRADKKGALVTVAEMQKINEERKRAKVKEDKWKDAMATNRRERQGKRRRERHQRAPRRDRKRDRVSMFFGYDRYRERDRGGRGGRYYGYDDHSDHPDYNDRRRRRRDRDWRDERYSSRRDRYRRRR